MTLEQIMPTLSTVINELPRASDMIGREKRVQRYVQASIFKHTFDVRMLMALMHVAGKPWARQYCVLLEQLEETAQ